MSSQCSSQSNERFLRRGANGRFMSHGLPSILKKKQKERQKSFIDRKKQRKREIHESFLDAVCLPGSASDWVPGSRSDGPLVQILHAVVAKGHRIGPNGHVEGLREYCNANAQLGLVAVSTNKKKNPKRVKGFRLPKLTRRRTEISKLRNWIESLAEDELRSDNVEIATDECLKIIAEFELSKKQISQVPVQSSAPANTDCFNNVGSSSINICRSRCPNCNSTLQNSESVQVERHVSQDAAPFHQRVDNISTVSPHDQVELQNNNVENQRESDHDVTSREKIGQEILETARDDSVFIMICAIFDETRETPYGWYGGQFLKEYQKNGAEPTPLVREMLTFCFWRRFGIRNEQEHQKREETLRYNMRLLKIARRALRLPGYDELQWKYNSTSHDYIGARNSTNEDIDTN